MNRIEPGQVWLLGNARLEVLSVEPCGAVNFKPPFDHRLMEPWSYTVRKGDEKVTVTIKVHYCLMHNVETRDGTIRVPALQYDKNSDTFGAHKDWSIWERMRLGGMVSDQHDPNDPYGG